MAGADRDADQCLIVGDDGSRRRAESRGHRADRGKNPARLSLTPQRLRRLDPRRPAGGDVRREKRHGAQQGGDADERQRVGGTRLVEQLREGSAERQRHHYPDRDTGERQPRRAGDDHVQDIPLARPKREPQADFSRSSRDGVRHHAVDANRRQKNGDAREDGEQRRSESAFRE